MKDKILILCPRFLPSIGGVEEQVRSLGESFIKMGYEVDVFTKKYDKTLKTNEVTYGININRFKNEVQLFFWLLKEADRQLFIMSRHYYRNTFVLSILKTLGLINTKTIICADSGGDNDEFMRIKKGLGLFHRVYFRIIKQNDYLNCINQDNEKHLQLIIGASNKITKIYNGIDFGNIKPQKRTKIENILFLGRLIPEKGIFETINAFMNIKDKNIKLNIVGSGTIDDESRIKILIKNDKRIKFLGPLYGEKKEGILKESDLLIFPSYYPEGQPILLLEAVKYNLPVITTDIADNKIIFGENMIYSRKMDTRDLQKKIEYIIKNINTFNYDYRKIRKDLGIKNTCQKFLDLVLI